MSLLNLESQNKEFLEKIQVEKLVSDAMNSLIHSKSERDHPITFLIKYLTMMVPREELKAQGIQISGSFPRRYPAFLLNEYPESSRALVKNYINESIWSKLRPKQTKYEGRLSHCLISFFENPTEKIGLYACDPEAYKMFSNLFDPLIRDYYGYDISTRQVFNHNYNLESVNWIKSHRTNVCIKGLTISFSRNIDEFPFLPLLNDNLKASIETQVKNVLFDDLIHVSTELADLNASDRKILLEEGYIVEKSNCLEQLIPVNKTLEKSYIYASKDFKEVISICNEDHIKVTYAEKEDLDFKKFFEKAFKKIQTIDDKLNIAKHPHYGVLNVSPTNLGTGMQIKVAITLNKSTSNIMEIEEIRKKCELVGINLISKGNKKYELATERPLQLGKAEIDMINSLLECILRILAEEEKALKIEDEMEFQEMKKNMPVFNETNTTLVKHIINEERWEEVAEILTKNGYTMYDCLVPAINGHKSGICAHDEECFVQFDSIFSELAILIHEDFKPIKLEEIQLTNMSDVLCIEKKNEFKNIYSGYLMWQANLSDYIFVPSLKGITKRAAINIKIREIIEPLINEHKLQQYLLSSDEFTKENPMVNDLLQERAKVDYILGDGWPEGRLAFSNGEIVFLTNIFNHLTFFVKINKSDIENSLNTFAKIYNILTTKNKKVWAFTEKWGFQNILIDQIGYAFFIKIVLKVTNLDYIPQILSFSFQSKQQTSTEGDKIILTNKMKFMPINLSIKETLTSSLLVLKKIEELSSNFIFFENYQGLIKEILTSSMYKTYKDQVCENIISINDIVNTALANPDDPLGLFNESEESFYFYKDLYFSCIRKLCPEFKEFNEFKKESEKQIDFKFKIINTEMKGTLTFSRNFKKISFPAYYNESKRKQVFEIFKSIIDKNKAIFEGEIFPMPSGTEKEIAPEEIREDLALDLALISISISKSGNTSPNANSKKETIYGGWPNDRYFYISKDKSIRILVNVRNHLKFIGSFSGGNFNETYTKLTDIIKIFEKEVGFSFDSSVGYLQSDVKDIISKGISFSIILPELNVNLEKLKSVFPDFKTAENKNILINLKISTDLNLNLNLNEAELLLNFWKKIDSILAQNENQFEKEKEEEKEKEKEKEKDKINKFTEVKVEKEQININLQTAESIKEKELSKFENKNINEEMEIKKDNDTPKVDIQNEESKLMKTSP